jgi:3-hydroxyisobutyrate dehydrogenase
MKNNDLIRENYTDYSLNELEQDCWNRLVTGAIKSRNPFHTPSVATLSKGEVSMRTVVLRKALPEERELRFHTDVRSIKWDDLLIIPAISALFYDADARVQ